MEAFLVGALDEAHLCEVAGTTEEGMTGTRYPDMVCLAMLVATGKPQYLLYGLLCGYGFAWVGHFGFEKNRPASFKRPLYSFMGDWAMYMDIWLGKVKIGLLHGTRLKHLAQPES